MKKTLILALLSISLTINRQNMIKKKPSVKKAQYAISLIGFFKYAGLGV
ncbi:hypothetical protein [Pedobacter miscanthi]|nr:hypothetical protein [Pedobacter miscanthi]